MKIFSWIIGVVLIIFLFGISDVSAAAVSLIGSSPTSVRVYDKYEVKFNVQTASKFPFFQYDGAPPPGVSAGTGVTVEGVFKKGGRTWVQPAFYMTEVSQVGSGSTMYFKETEKKYWALRFSPQETGTYDVSIHVKDAAQDVTQVVGTFTATTASKKGYIKVSKSDTRYFEFSNGELFWPIGPALVSDNDFAKYAASGINFERPWMGGLGAYSSNWARWKSSAARLGNEGFASPLDFYPPNSLAGSDLSYSIFSPAGYRIWLGTYADTMFGPRIEKGKKYAYKLTLKTANLSAATDPSRPHGFVIKSMVGTGLFGSYDSDRTLFETVMRNIDPTVQPYAAPQTIVAHISENKAWHTVTGTFTADAKTGRNSIYLYLDNVNFDQGQVNIDEFSMREVLSDGSLGGEIIRNPKADLHTYVEQRPAAFLDWQVRQGEQYGVYYKYVVHDKNDQIQNHLKTDGSFVPGPNQPGDGYFQAENTKARWLLRQWYRYIIARWGYSTAIHSWELLNEGPPQVGPHFNTAKAFANYMHTVDSHPHMAVTSFWCCWRPTFWADPAFDYADIHEYTTNPLEEKNGVAYPYDMAMWNFDTGRIVSTSNVGKPIVRAETGIAANAPVPAQITALGAKNTPNPGVWFHNLLWSQLTPFALFDTGYWFSNHFANINKEAISRPFYAFVQNLDFNKGGYVDAASVVSNTKIRVWGQKNLAKNQAHLWIQNSDHTWKNVMDGVRTGQSGTVAVKMNPNVGYLVEWWNTCSEKEGATCLGGVIRTENKTADGGGNISLTISNLADDTAVKIVSAAVVIGSGEVDGVPPVNAGDLVGVIEKMSGADQYRDGRINVFDFAVVVKKLGT